MELPSIFRKKEAIQPITPETTPEETAEDKLGRYLDLLLAHDRPGAGVERHGEHVVLHRHEELDGFALDYYDKNGNMNSQLLLEPEIKAEIKTDQETGQENAQWGVQWKVTRIDPTKSDPVEVLPNRPDVFVKDLEYSFRDQLGLNLEK